MRGRLENLSGGVLAEGPLIKGTLSRPIVDSPTAGASATRFEGVPDVYWTLSGVDPMLDGSDGVLIINTAERVDVLVMNGVLRPR